jgi:hypothetical protein
VFATRITREPKVSGKENIKLTCTLGIVKAGYELCPVKDMQELKNIMGLWYLELQ